MFVVFIFRNDCFDYLSRTNNKQKKSARIKFYLCEYDTGYFLTKKKPTQASLVGFSMCSELWLIQIYCTDTSNVAIISDSPPASSRPVFGLVGVWRNVNVNVPVLTAPATNVNSVPK